MVIVEKQKDGTYRLRGRSPNERATVPWWPCNGFTVRGGAVPTAPKEWVEEAVEMARCSPEWTMGDAALDSSVYCIRCGADLGNSH